MSIRFGYANYCKNERKIEGRKHKILSLVDDNNKNNHLLPSSKEITDMDEIDIELIIKEKEEREREGEEAYQKQLKMRVF